MTTIPVVRDQVHQLIMSVGRAAAEAGRHSAADMLSPSIGTGPHRAAAARLQVWARELAGPIPDAIAAARRGAAELADSARPGSAFDTAVYRLAESNADIRAASRLLEPLRKVDTDAAITIDSDAVKLHLENALHRFRVAVDALNDMS